MPVMSILHMRLTDSLRHKPQSSSGHQEGCPLLHWRSVCYIFACKVLVIQILLRAHIPCFKRILRWLINTFCIYWIVDYISKMQLRVRRTGCLRPSSAQAGCKPAAAHLHRALLGARSAADLAACRRRIYTISNAGSASAGLPAEGDASNISAAQGSSSREDKPKKSLWGHIKYFFVGG